MARTDWPIVWEILVRDKLVCVYCGLDGKQSFQSWCQLLHGVDHLVPASSLNAEAYQITRDNMGNLVTSCWICNRAKGTFQSDASGPYQHKKCSRRTELRRMAQGIDPTLTTVS